jgi:hypothetical protein
MRTVYRAANLIDGHLVRGLLESHGIPAYVSGHHLTGGIGELPVAGLVQVMVGAQDVERAERLIAEAGGNDPGDEAIVAL